MKTVNKLKQSQWLSQIFANLLSDQKHKWKTYKRHVLQVSRDDFDKIYEEIHSLCVTDMKYSDISAFTLSHLVVFHFEHFVDDILKNLIYSDDTNDMLLSVALSLPVLDPCSGFMCWAPRFLPEFAGKVSFDFFSSQSKDLETSFGCALTRLRLMIYEKSQTLMDDVKRESESRTGVFVPSFLSTLIGTMAPKRYRKYNISCGFPHRIEILIAISNYQRVRSFVRDKGQHVHSVLTGLVASWSEIYNRLTSSSRKMEYKTLQITGPDTVSDCALVAFLKLIGFTNPGVAYNFDKSIGKMIMNLVLSDNASLSSFVIVWTQSLMMIDSSVVFYVFDEVFSLLPSMSEVSLEMFHTFVHSVCRFVDVLSCLPERYLTESQCMELHAFSLATLCVPHPRVRKTGYKLAIALDRYECDGKTTHTVVKFLSKHRQDIERQMLALFEAFPAVELWKYTLEDVSIVDLFEVMVSHDEVLWQIMLSAVFTCAAGFFSQTFMTVFRRLALMLDKGGSRPDDPVLRRLFMLNLLTGLGAMGQNPMMFLDHTDEEEANVTRQQSQMIIDHLIDELQNYIHVCYPSIRIMMSTVAVSLFSDLIPRLLDCPSLECVVVAMRGIAWNVDFCTVFQNDDFRIEFCRMYDNCSTRLLALDLTPNDFVVKLSRNYVAKIDNHSQLVRDFLVVTYRVLLAMKQRFVQCPKAPFPSCELFLITDQAFMQTMQKVFPFIISCCLYPVTDDVSERLHYYALHNLSIYFNCCPLENPSLLTNQTFLDLIYTFSETVNGILFNFFKHNMVSLLPIYLQKSVTHGGAKFFMALCSYFKAPRPRTLTISETLLQQWESIEMESFDTRYQDAVNVLYEESGHLIASCLFHLSMTDKHVRDSAFILLGSMCPVLLMYNNPHSGDKLVRLFQNFIHYSGQALTIEGVNGIANVIAARMSFCLEQVIDRLFDAFPDVPNELTERLFFVMIPLIDSIRLDLENRVVSSQTELNFMRFSCCSFVERLVRLLLPLDIATDDSLILAIWPSLALRSGFEFLLLSLIESAHSTPELHKPVVAVISALYKTDMSAVLDCLTKHLSFSFWLNETICTPLTHKTMLKEMLSKDDDYDEHEQVLQGLFVLEVLASIAEDDLAGVIPSLPIIFTACVLNIEKFGRVLNQILRSISRHMGHDTPPMVHDLLRFPTTDITQLSSKLYKVLLDMKANLAEPFCLEILRWSICCGDIQIARTAVRAYSGFLEPNNVVLVGLFARVLWILSTALSQVTEADAEYDASSYVEYVSEVLRALYRMAEVHLQRKDYAVTIGIFWIATECLLCHQKAYESIFDAALQIIVLIMQYPEMFELLKDPSRPCEMWHFTPNFFWKYHRPWSESFGGYLPLICAYEGTNVHLCIKAIIKVLISGYTPLLTSKDGWVYTVIVLLMPWMWKVVMTDMSRFMFTSEDVELMDSTVEILKTSVSNSIIAEGLDEIIESGDISSYSTVQDVFCESLKHIHLDDIPMIMRFYTSMLLHGDKHMKLPLYVLTTLIVQSIPDSVRFLSEFTAITEASHEKKRQYHRNYLAAVRSLASLSYPEETMDKDIFPLFSLMEHIVVVDIPHLYEFDEAAEMMGTSGSLNALLPICPVDPSFVGVPIMQKIRNILERLELSPFKDWSSQIGKGMTFLFDDKNPGRRTVSLDHVSFKQFIPTTASNFSRQVSNDNMMSIFLRTEDEADPADFIIIPEPTGMAILQPNAFVPSISVVDDILNVCL